MIFGRRMRGFRSTQEQRRFMRNSWRGGFMNAIFGLFMFRLLRAIVGCMMLVVVLGVILAIAFIVS